mgnify:CR=1 FL=1
MGKPKKYNSRQLTENLRQLAAEAHDWSMEDGAITKGEALAKLLWKKALGYTEETTDDEGNTKQVYHKPEAWAIQLVYERMEGKTPQAIQDDEGNKRKAKDEVRDLAKARLNDLAKTAKGSESDLKAKGPPKRKKKDDGDDA